MPRPCEVRCSSARLTLFFPLAPATARSLVRARVSLCLVSGLSEVPSAFARTPSLGRADDFRPRNPLRAVVSRRASRRGEPCGALRPLQAPGRRCALITRHRHAGKRDHTYKPAHRESSARGQTARHRAPRQNTRFQRAIAAATLHERSPASRSLHCLRARKLADRLVTGWTSRRRTGAIGRRAANRQPVITRATSTRREFASSLLAAVLGPAFVRAEGVKRVAPQFPMFDPRRAGERDYHARASTSYISLFLSPSSSLARVRSLSRRQSLCLSLARVSLRLSLSLSCFLSFRSFVRLLARSVRSLIRSLIRSFVTCALSRSLVLLSSPEESAIRAGR